MTKLIEITIPVYNESKTLKLKVLETIDYLSSNNYWNTVGLCIADNGSADDTLKQAYELQQEYPDKLRVVSVGAKGVGLALKQAWASSSFPVVGYMDLDLATDIKHVKDIVNQFQQNPEIDFIYGSRLSKKSIVQNRTIKREIVSRIFNFILRAYLGTSVKDAMCGFKFLKRKNLSSLRENGAVSDGWFFCSEILVLSEKLGYVVEELPVKWIDDLESKVKVFQLAIEYLKAMHRLKSEFTSIQVK